MSTCSRQDSCTGPCLFIFFTIYIYAIMVYPIGSMGLLYLPHLPLKKNNCRQIYHDYIHPMGTTYVNIIELYAR